MSGDKFRSIQRLALAVVCLAPVLVVAQGQGERVDNFRLLDHQDSSQELYYFADASAVVLMAHSSSCAGANADYAALQRLHTQFADDSVEFLLINSSDSRDVIRGHAADVGLTAPILLDTTQIIGESLALQTAGEMLVINPQSWSLAYRGDVAAGAQALAEVVAGQAVTQVQQPAKGCDVVLPGLAQRDQHAQISYSQTIAPMLQDKCVTCHREGGIGPWPMNSYNMVQGFAPMIREVVRTQRMPPWHADPHYGEFSNDRSLSPEQVSTLVHWIEAGAPRGDGPDVLAQTNQHYPLWALGEPDIIIEIPAEHVPATGVVDYKYKLVENPLNKDVWVRATEIIPGDRSVLHHVITRFGQIETDGPRAGRIGRRGGGGLGGYVPGAVADIMPVDTGTLLPADATFEFQMHYTTVGRATTDVSRMGIYLYDKPPKHRMEGMVLANPRIRIPPGAANHAEVMARVVPKDVLLYSLLPHAHYRGKASEFVAHYPDGQVEKLLSVPRYDFNWQTSYELKKPKLIPAGTKIVHRTWWDNSARNPANPDPTREVPWGRQSWDEMLFGAISFRALTDEEKAAAGVVGGEE
jgi:peroxiredoxin